MQRALDSCGFYEIVGESADGEELAGLLTLQYPDVVILDTAVSGRGIEMFLMQASAGRPVPTLALVDTESGKKHKTKSRKWKLNRLGKDVLFRDDVVSRNHVWARLLALADDLTAAKHTQTASKLQELIKGELARARHSGMRPTVVALATWPLDLIILAGGRGSAEVVTKLLPKIRSTRVPVLVAVDGEQPVDPRAFGSNRVNVRKLDESLELRRCEGLLVAPADGVVTFDPTTILLESGFDSLEAATTISAAAQLGPAGMTVLLSGSTDLAMTLGSVVNAEGVVAAIDPAESPIPEGPEAAISWQVARAALTTDELAWVIEHAVPRRL